MTLMGCASARDKKLAKFREITKDICIDNHHEVILAQRLYNELLNAK